MIDNILTLLKLENLLKGRRSSYDKRIMHPTREWLVGLGIFSVIVIVGSVQSAHSFSVYQNIRSKEGGVFQEKITHYNQALAQTALGIYIQKEEQFKLLQNEAPPVAAPETTSASEAEVRTSEVPVVDAAGTSTGDVNFVN